MDYEDCPLPEVAEALRPFVRSRQETAEIRRRLHKYLEARSRADGAPLSVASLSVPLSVELESPPSALSGVRKAYWKALQAHTAAQAKYDALKADLEDLKHQSPGRERNEDRSSVDQVHETYIPLLRQKEKHRKLQAIERAYLAITSAENNASTGALDDRIRKQIGDLPTPPNSQPSSTSNPEVDAKVMELKKAVIAAKRKADERKLDASPATILDGTAIPLQAEIAGLQKALQELTGWMESQLTIIAETEADTQSIDSPARNGTPAKVPLSAEDIEDLYEQYLEARERLVETVNNPPETQNRFNLADLVAEPSSIRDAELSRIATKSSAEIVLPYIPRLLAVKQEEQALIQQGAYLRRQISTAEGDTERLISRLGDESHLVHPGSRRGKDWAVAAEEAGSCTENSVKERLGAGDAAVEAAREALEEIQNMPGRLEGMVERS